MERGISCVNVVLKKIKKIRKIRQLRINDKIKLFNIKISDFQRGEKSSNALKGLNFAGKRTKN